ncbi:MAG: hypothetical protein P8J87_13025, partial [Verrucomicrobiales bacterium]|nr:hypothetical protein [Verrucomicrobiales bacterium]
MNTRRIIIILLAVSLVLLARYKFPKERENPSNVIETPGPYPDQNLDPLDPFPAPDSTEPQVQLTAVARELAPRLNAADGSITEDLDVLNSILTEY